MSKTVEEKSPWMTTGEAAEYRKCTKRTIMRHRVGWTSKPPAPGKIRFKMMVIGTKIKPRYYRPDVTAAYDFEDLKKVENSMSRE
jgi:hypothetical protein